MFHLQFYYKKRRNLTYLFFSLETICLLLLYFTDQYDYFRTSLGNLVFWFIYTYIESKKGWKLPYYVRFIVIISILSDSFFGEFLGLYVTSPPYDRLQHFFGTYSMALWLFFVIQQLTKMRFESKKLQVILLISFATSLGTFYELIEFYQDQFLHPVIKNQPSLLDTDLDLVSDLLGGIFASIHYVFFAKSRIFYIES